MDRFSWISDRVARATAVAEKAGATFSFKTTVGASEDQILTCESAISCRLPETYRLFLRSSNGASLQWESSKSGGFIDILPCESIPGLLLMLREDMDLAFASGVEQARWGRLIPIVDVGDGNYLFADPDIMTTDDACIFYGNHEEAPESWRLYAYVASSFEAVLLRMLDEIGFRWCSPQFWSNKIDFTL